LAVCLFVQTAAAGQFENAKAAYDRGDYATALKLMQPLAEKGSAVAQFGIGTMYARGQGVPQDLTKAAKWFRKAADQGDAAAQANLGLMYSTGQGVPRDYAEAVKWLRKAADQGYPPYILAIMYENGVGTPQDYVQAYKWFKLAGTSNGLTRVAKKMTPDQISEAQRLAQEWLAAHPKK
jgi:TPR repeat protein